MIRLVIVDDHTLFREGLASILRMEPDFEISALAGSVHEAVEVIQSVRPDIVLMDFTLPDGSGAEATHRLLTEFPECKVIFLTMSDSDETLFSAIRSGAKGYLLKSMSPKKLATSIRAVHQGESALSRSMTLNLMEEFSRTQAPDPMQDASIASLTHRELDVLKELASGLTNKEIARRLFLSENTIRYHVHSILEKLNLSDRKTAAKFAKLHGLAE